MKLRPEFEAIRASLLHRQVATIEEALGELTREETRLRSQSLLDNSAPGDSVFAVGRGGSEKPQFQQGDTSTLTCHFCQEGGHIQPHCKRRNICIYCKRSGHIILECKSLARRSKTGSSSSAGGSRFSGDNRGAGGSSYALAVAPSPSAGSSSSPLTPDMV
ncbi:unnamed protein product [Linum trigynum]|uniref:CCHC-type domain-containing protein n=1 Tax=Linum trigynum TaxID=586398 RepID=A0AAV2E5Y5_9ROSI